MRQLMKQENTSPMQIIVIGDVTMDWNLARANQHLSNEFSWNPDVRTSLSWQRGGAALLADLVSRISADFQEGDIRQHIIFQPNAPTSSLDPTNPDYNHSYSIWAQFKEGNLKVWRVTEFLGLDRYPSNGSLLPVLDEPVDVGLVIIDDAGIGFRDHPEAC